MAGNIYMPALNQNYPLLSKFPVDDKDKGNSGQISNLDTPRKTEILSERIDLSSIKLKVNRHNIDDFLNMVEYKDVESLNFNISINFNYQAENIISKKTSQGQSAENSKSVVSQTNISVTSASMRNQKIRQSNYFYNQTERIYYSINKEYRKDFLNIREKLRVKFLYDFNVNFKMLTQFERQSNILSQRDDSVFPDYLNITSKLIDKSPKVTEEFFDRIDEALDNALEKLETTINLFFNSIINEFGLNSGKVNKFKENLLEKIIGLFEKLTRQFSSIKDKLLSNYINSFEVQGRTEKQVKNTNLSSQAPRT